LIVSAGDGPGEEIPDIRRRSESAVPAAGISVACASYPFMRR
jgi:hypothetical protein